MYKKSVLLFSALLLAACSNSADTQTAANKQEVVKSQSDGTTKTKAEGAATTSKVTKESDLICRTERPLGTRFGKKVCRTRSQIEEDRKQAKDLMPRHRECTGPSEVCI